MLKANITGEVLIEIKNRNGPSPDPLSRHSPNLKPKQQIGKKVR